MERRLDGDLDTVPRLIVAIDEANATLPRLARYWETFRQKDDPKTSPAIAALEQALWVGRAARVRVIFDGRPQATALRGAAHELFATVILARFTTDTWQILAPDTGPAPKQRHPQQGHFHVIQHGEVDETQEIRMTDADVVAWLTDPDDPTARPNDRHTTGPGARHDTPGPGWDEPAREAWHPR
ncbi:hypothetical protein I6J42_34735 (plasmid) [Streptomyces californicus]|uniref:Uncharacterized protein n=1 Tax=Streptomyces californicus TaxID=67351 RepID=A0ABD7D8T4_9ACTN|nr:hypothetical protein [Streptomyces californicus]QRV39225.1 hypothetical protein I6J42_34735 [Streptomyces californicus]QRV52677.1 hypothetical protein I6J43_34755 [Streptomyces californicus]